MAAQTTTAQTMTAQTATTQQNQTTTAQHSPTIAIQPNPVHNRKNTQPTKISCPAGCGIEFVGKDPKLGVLRHLRTYAKQWKKYQEAPESDGVKQALTKDVDNIKKHWEEHKKSIIYENL